MQIIELCVGHLCWSDGCTDILRSSTFILGGQEQGTAVRVQLSEYMLELLSMIHHLGFFVGDTCKGLRHLGCNSDGVLNTKTLCIFLLQRLLIHDLSMCESCLRQLLTIDPRQGTKTSLRMCAVDQILKHFHHKMPIAS